MNHRYRTRIVPALLPATHLWQLLSLSFTFTQAFLPPAYRATPPLPRSLGVVLLVVVQVQVCATCILDLHR